MGLKGQITDVSLAEIRTLVSMRIACQTESSLHQDVTQSIQPQGMEEKSEGSVRQVR